MFFHEHAFGHGKMETGMNNAVERSSRVRARLLPPHMLGSCRFDVVNRDFRTRFHAISPPLKLSCPADASDCQMQIPDRCFPIAFEATLRPVDSDKNLAMLYGF